MSITDGNGPQPYLKYCGVEVANAARTVAYLRNGLGDTSQGKWELGGGSLCGALTRDSGQAAFVSPAADAAPWYDAREPGSASFLGIVLLDFKGYDGVGKRAVTPQLSGLGGASFGKKRREPRKLTFRAALISADGAGAEYGLRWLTSVLGSPSCDDCDGCDATFRLLCPPSNGSQDSLGQWTTYNTVLTDGPHEVEPWLDRRSRIDNDVLAGCRDFVIVEWEMTAGNPWLYKQPSLAAQFTMTQSADCTDICTFLNGDPGATHCVTVTPPSIGVIAPVFVLHSYAGIGTVVLEAYKDCPQPLRPAAIKTRVGGRNPSRPRVSPRRTGVMPHTRLIAATMERGQRFLLATRLLPPAATTPIPPVRSITVDHIPPATTIVVDSAQRKAVAISDADGSMSDATHLLDAAGTGVEWLDFAACDDIGCICARIYEPCANGVVEVSVYTQAREG